MRSGERIDRRMFIQWLPRQVAAGVKALVVTDGTSTGRSLAVIDVARCLAWGDGDCQLCYLRCPLRDEALVLRDGIPTVVASRCDGCGICIEACRSVNDLGAIQRVEVVTTEHTTPSPTP